MGMNTSGPPTMDWQEAEFETSPATILGGRWDGHVVEFRGKVVVYKGDQYVALRCRDGRTFYLLEALLPQWFAVGR